MTLPIELQEIIFSYLTLQDFLNLRSTCRNFRHIGAEHMRPKGRIKLEKNPPFLHKNSKDQAFFQQSKHTLIYINPRSSENAYELHETITVTPVRNGNVYKLSLHWSRSDGDHPFLSAGPLWARPKHSRKKSTFGLHFITLQRFFRTRKNNPEMVRAADILRNVTLTQLNESIKGKLDIHQKLFLNYLKNI